jgi:hypothetical protein
MTLKRLLRKNRKYLLPNRLCKQPLATTTSFIFDSVYITTIIFITDLFLFFYERYFSAFFLFCCQKCVATLSFFSTEKLFFFAQETERKVSKN